MRRYGHCRPCQRTVSTQRRPTASPLCRASTGRVSRCRLPVRLRKSFHLAKGAPTRTSLSPQAMPPNISFVSERPATPRCGADRNARSGAAAARFGTRVVRIRRHHGHVICQRQGTHRGADAPCSRRARLATAHSHHGDDSKAAQNAPARVADGRGGWVGKPALAAVDRLCHQWRLRGCRFCPTPHI